MSQSNPGPRPISDLFTVYKQRLRAPERTVVRAAVVVLSHRSKVTVTETMVAYTPHTRTLALIMPAPMKQRLLTDTSGILKELERELGIQNCPRSIV